MVTSSGRASGAAIPNHVELDFRPCEPTDLPGLGRLFARAYGSQLSEAEWRWKYDANPFGRLAVVASRRGELVAYYGGWWWKMRGEAGELDVLEVCDTMTDPSIRVAGRRPVLVDLHEYFLGRARGAGVAFCFGCSNPPARRFGTRFLGYRFFESLCVLSGPLAALDRGARAPWERVSDDFPGGHDLLAGEIHARSGWRTDRSRAVLSWRYWSRPTRYYRVYHVGPAPEEPTAWAVVSTVGALAQLVDLQWGSREAQGSLESLLSLVARDLAPHGVERVELALERGPEADLVSRWFGLEPGGDANVVGVRPVDGRIDAEAVLRAASLRRGDFDFF